MVQLHYENYSSPIIYQRFLMETRHNFSVLSHISPPLGSQEKLKYCIIFKYGSVRKFAGTINISHTAFFSWLNNPNKYPTVNQKIINVIGFDPFAQFP